MGKSKINSLRINCIALFLLFSITGRAQNFSGLQGKELTKIDDSAFALLQLGAKKLEGQIDKVTVIYSGEKTLKLEIQHSGIESTLISYKITDSEKKPLSQINYVEYAAIESEKPLNVEITLKDNLPEGTEIQSFYLQIDIKKETKNFLPTTFLYGLEKSWKTEISAENLVIPIKLEPRGSAIELTSVRFLVIPARSQQFREVRDHRTSSSNRIIATNPTNTSQNTIENTGNRPTPRSSTGTTDHRNTSQNDSRNAGNRPAPRNDNGTADHRNTSQNTIENTGNRPTPRSSTGTTDHRNTSQNDSRNAGNRPAPRNDNGTADHRNTSQNNTITTNRTNASRYNNNNKRDHRNTPINDGGLGTGSTEILGPNYDSQISLWDYYKADGANFEYPYEISNVNMTIYPDKNPESGRFYYLPSAYHLRWTPDEGYKFRMIYGTADDASSGDIRMSGTLTPGLGNNETDLMKSLLEAYLKNNGNFSSNYEIKIMPIKTSPIVTLSAGLQGQYNISSEKINVGMQSEINAPIEVSWVTDNRTKEEIEVALSEGIGIQGTMTLAPDSEGFPEQIIPIRITLADVRTLGQFSLRPNKWRTEEWTNNTPYPLKLKYIHALVTTESTPIIYSWSLGNTEVPPNAKVNFDATKMPKWLEDNGKSERIWIDYGIVNCPSCVNKVMDELTGGTSGSKVKHITFESLKVFENLDAAFLNIKIRSKQADPKGNTIVELPSVRIKEDLTTYSVGPLYLTEGADPEYEYYYTIITSNGIPYRSDDWKSSKELEMFIGLNNLKDLKDENGKALVKE